MERKWFMTFHMKQNTHSNAFSFDAHEQTQHTLTNIFIRLRMCSMYGTHGKLTGDEKEYTPAKKKQQETNF